MNFVSPLIGGALIGLAATLLLLINGRVLGVSGILAGLLPPKDDSPWRMSFIFGLLCGGLLMIILSPQSFSFPPLRYETLIPAGLLVGFGTRMSGGCTSGHGICGMSRLSMRSIVATLLFMGSGILTVFFLRQFGGNP